MRIGYEITAVGERPSGIGTYTLELLQGLAAAEEAHEYLLLANRSHHRDHLGQLPRVRDLWRPFPNRMLWMQLLLPRQLRATRPDLCHFPNSLGPLDSPCPYVVTIHDMTLSLMPRHHPLRKQLLVRPLVPLVARRAARVITVSNAARNDLVRLLRVPAERVVVIPEAAAPIFRPTSAEERRRVRAAHGLPERYVLFVGTLEPRKNLVRLIRAWGALRARGLVAQQLVLVGAPGWQYRAIYAEASQLGCAEDVIFTGYVPRADLPGIFGAADVFAFPSLAEGFGLPVIEALACGTPTLISATAALTEVAGDAALTVDPRDIASIRDGLERLLTDEGLRRRLRAAGLARARDFSWQRTARETLAVYRVAAAQPAGRLASV
ncbi:MAG: glycosyltransferase family 1 protein [Chloroflexi bacterium OHK40]